MSVTWSSSIFGRAAAACAVGAALAAAASPAGAAQQGGLGMQRVLSPGTHLHETSPKGYPSGPLIAWLEPGTSFRTTSIDGEWCAGFAYGYVNRWGHVLCGKLKKV